MTLKNLLSNIHIDKQSTLYKVTGVDEEWIILTFEVKVLR
jgi:hypothetical protein